MYVQGEELNDTIIRYLGFSAHSTIPAPLHYGSTHLPMTHMKVFADPVLESAEYTSNGARHCGSALIVTGTTPSVEWRVFPMEGGTFQRAAGGGGWSFCCGVAHDGRNA